MAEMIALNYEALEGHLNAIKLDAEGIISTIDVATKKVDSFNDAAPIADATVAAVAIKLGEIRDILKDVPDQLEKLNLSLKEKDEALSDTVNQMARGIADL